MILTKFTKLLLSLFIITSFVQIPLESLGVEGAQLNYLFLVLATLFTFNKIPLYYRIYKSEKLLTLLLLNCIVVSIFGLIEYGFYADNIRLIILLFSLQAGIWAFSEFTADEIQSVIKVASYCVIGFLVVRLLVFLPETYMLIIVGRKALGASYPFLTAGGHNIEVTTLFILAGLVSSKRIFFTLFVVSLAFTFIYESRVGLILALVVYLFRKNLFELNLKKISISIFFILTAFFVLDFFEVEVLERFIDIERELRFAELGVGRLGFYLGAGEMIKETGVMVGVGNAVRVMGDVTGIPYRESNVHNIYLQYLLDSGWQSFMLLIIVAIRLVRKSLVLKEVYQPSVVIIIYVFSGLIQYTGYDSLPWFFIGGLLSVSYRNRVVLR